MAETQPDASAETPPPTTTPTTATTTETTVTTTTTLADGPVNQAESGLKYDYGLIVSYEIVDGDTWISFDRGAFGINQLQGTALDFEPRYEMATDFHGGLNQNPRLRTYRLANDFQVLELDPDTFEAGCSADPVDVNYVESDLDLLLATAYEDGSLVSLTFDSQVEVVLIRDQRGC